MAIFWPTIPLTLSSRGYGDLLSDPPLRRTVQAETFYRALPATFSRPVVLSCSDERIYVVKGRNAGRAVVNEHVVGKLAETMGAPVPEVALVDVPQELISIQPELSHMLPGLAHGSEWVPDCTDRLWLDHMDEPENRGRFALLAVMYTWVNASDHQLIYSKNAPHLVYSVDHGHFLAGPTWTVETLSAVPAISRLDPLFDGVFLTRNEISTALSTITSIGPTEVAAAVSSLPEEWGLARPEQIAVCEYLDRRRRELLESQGG